MGEPTRTWSDDVARAILDFFDQRRRALPWRETDDPYRIWVSEVMLQQTRVETVIPYYERWLERFPDLATLAAAPQDEVLAAWAGLGYYSRARNLHRAAGFVRERLQGDVPRSAAALRQLPGIGDYTAGAIASIAFGERAPAIDGNARRVLSRLHDADLDGRALHEAGRALVPADRPGDFNQGLMELGATLCTPRRPRCDACPARLLCRARDTCTQGLRPAPKTRAAVPEFHFLALVALTRSHVLLQRRTGRLLHGLWCFPAAAAPADAAAFARRLLASRARPRPCGSDSHTFTHRVEHTDVFALALRRTRQPRGDGEYRWFPHSELGKLALPAAQRRIARLVGL